MEINDIKTALRIFEEAASKHGDATENGDYKTANQSYKLIVNSINLLKKENAVNALEIYLSNLSIGVRLWAAGYLLPVNELKSIQVLEEIAKVGNIHSLTAEITISEWRKGNLKF